MSSAFDGVDPQVLIVLALDLTARYSVYQPATDLSIARCPKCKSRVGPVELRRVSTYTARFPKTDTCSACGGAGDPTGGWFCKACDGKGYLVVGSVNVPATLACLLCCTEMRDGQARAGYAPVYTRGRAG